MRSIEVIYHRENGSWWAESDDLPGFSALARDFESVRNLVREAATAESEEYQLVEELEGLPLNWSVRSPAKAAWYDVRTASSSPSAVGAPRASGVFVGLVDQYA